MLSSLCSCICTSGHMTVFVCVCLFAYMTNRIALRPEYTISFSLCHCASHYWHAQVTHTHATRRQSRLTDPCMPMHTHTQRRGDMLACGMQRIQDGMEIYERAL